ncbi:MAG: hypothetical protein KA139_00635 [Rhodobacteraceae bacterium]|nr:hypothetical protein [Paracoccaceae bacterium]
MTLRDLERHGYCPVPHDASGQDVSLAFAFDANYLFLWKVAIRSLACSGNFIDSPIIVYTDDPLVLADPVVRKVTDRVVLLEEPRKKLLYALARENVQRGKERAQWNRGTFLKWAVFEEHATEAVLFLDVDMIFLDKFDTVLLDLSDRSFICCRQYHGEHRQSADGTRLTPDQSAQVVTSMIRCKLEGFHPRSINSGMMLLRRPLLSDDFFGIITDHARSAVLINEQRHFTTFFQARPDQIAFISPRFNFQEHYLGQLTWDEQRRMLGKISVLHYAGSGKPWKVSASASFRPSSALWHWHRTEAETLLRAES